LQDEKIHAVVQIFPRQPPEQGRIAVQRQGQADLAVVGVVKFEKSFPWLAVAKDQAVEPPAIGDQLL
jgi:hypothetical protein